MGIYYRPNHPADQSNAVCGGRRVSNLTDSRPGVGHLS
jgi:hypothetical protein